MIGRSFENEMRCGAAL